MVSFEIVKTLGIFFAPILIPRAISFYRTLKVSLTTRPTPIPLTSGAARALNILFVITAVFLVLSLPFNPYAPHKNIFAQTGSRLTTPTEILFSRLSRFRAQSALTPADELLRSKLTTPAARKLYLRFGPDTLVSCPFCSTDNVQSYLLYHLAFNTLLPHLFQFLTLGIVTSASLVGKQAGEWRNKFILAALALAMADVYLTMVFEPAMPPAVTGGFVVPSSLYTSAALLRPLVFTVFDALCAAVIYLSATRRFFYTPPSAQEQAEQLIATSTALLSGITGKLHGLSVTRNAVVRNPTLKNRDDVYWRAVVAMEGPGNDQAVEGSDVNPPGSIWEEEEVMRAMSRAMQRQGKNGGMDVAQLGLDAQQYVDKITAGLEARGGSP